MNPFRAVRPIAPNKQAQILAALDLTRAPFDAARALISEALPKTEEVVKLASLLQEHVDALRDAAAEMLGGKN